VQIAIFALLKIVLIKAEVAHLVEHNLAKVRVAGSSPVFRSEKVPRTCGIFFLAAPVVELVDTQDLKSCDPQRSYGFNSRLGHKRLSIFLIVFFIFRDLFYDTGFCILWHRPLRRNHFICTGNGITKI
jgi:hypothetical protein